MLLRNHRIKLALFLALVLILLRPGWATAQLELEQAAPAEEIVLKITPETV